MVGTLLFGGTDIASLATVEDLDDFWSSADLRGDLPSFPGIPGAVAVTRPTAMQVRTGQLLVDGSSLTATADAVAAVKAAARVGVAQTLTRRKVTSGGNLDATQTAITRSVAERWISDWACRLILTVETLDGPWYGSAVAIASAAGTQTITGDSPTRKMTLTLAAGAARTVTNTTNGYAFTFSTTAPTGGILVDVVARTATAITGGADYSGYLSWTKLAPLQLEPGTNILTVSAGTASISYQPAYL